MTGGPLRGDALVVAAAKASVAGERLPDLVDRAQALLARRLPEYRRRYETVFEDETQAVFFVEQGHWATLGADLTFEEREWQATRRAHEEHLERLGRRLDRDHEFQAALDLREVVVIGK